MAARLQQSSICEWTPLCHKSHPRGQCLPLDENVWVFCSRSVRLHVQFWAPVLSFVIVCFYVHMGNINIDCDSFCFSSLGFSFLGFCPRVMCALRPSPVRPFEFTCDCLRVCGSCCAQCWSLLLAYGICSGSPFFGRASSICLRSTGSSAYCLARMAGCPLHSA